MLLQAEAAECGLCCVAMVAGYFGYRTDLVTLRRRFAISSEGASLRTLMELAEALELSQRPLRLEMEELSLLKLPAILHWEFDHFVVLSKVTRNRLVIHDPAVGVRTYTIAEAAKRFTGVALELAPRTSFEAANQRSRISLWDFWRGTRGLGQSLVQLLLLSLLIQVFALATPFYMQVVVDDVLIKQDSDLLIVLAVGFLALTLISVLTKLVRGFTQLYLVNQLSYNVGSSVLHHLIRLPMTYYEKRHIGDVASRFGSIKPVQDFITGSFISVCIDGLLAISTLALMVIYSWQLALVVCAAVVLFALFRVAQFRPLREANHEDIAAKARLDSTFLETIRSIQSVKLAAREGDRQVTWQNHFSETINTSARIGRLTISYEAVNNTLTGFEYVLIIFLGARSVIDGVLSVGMLYAFLAYRSSFSSSAISIINQLIQYWMIGLHLERVSDIALTEKEEGLETESLLTLPIEGQITLRDVGYAYSSNQAKIIQGANLEIPAGSRVAVIGRSGVGKTTLLKIMMGLLAPTQGDVSIDGMALSSLGNRSYRKHMACVMQNDTLFSGSLRENICFFDVHSDQQKLERVCRTACIDRDIAQMPMGYETLIGDMGSALSIGQQQRVLLARALYLEPRVLFLDEGTAHVDAAAERQIMENLRLLDCTLIFVTHNSNLLDYADVIVVWSQQGPTLVRREVFDTSAVVSEAQR